MAIRCTRSATRASPRCFDVAKKAKVDQRYVQIAEAVEQIIPDTVGKDLRLNVSVANSGRSRSHG